MKHSLDNVFGGFWNVRGAALESNILNFENLFGQNFGRKIKKCKNEKKKKKRIKNNKSPHFVWVT